MGDPGSFCQPTPHCSETLLWLRTSATLILLQAHPGTLHLCFCLRASVMAVPPGLGMFTGLETSPTHSALYILAEKSPEQSCGC